MLITGILQKIGIKVEVNNYEMGALNNLIRTRKYEGLFFGQIVNHESDLYAFWHSSQRTDPGLNIALYSNPKVDVLLEKERLVLIINKPIENVLHGWLFRIHLLL